jgi:hypothetical protein
VPAWASRKKPSLTLPGLHRTYIGSVERGERNVALVDVIRLATALGRDPGDLLSGLLAAS